MARGWIKFDKNLPEKPEVWQIASELNLDPDAVVGKLMRVWTWFDENAVGCHAPSVTKKILERDVGVTGFCQAMINAGWMLDEDNTISLPNYDRHNGESAKQRALATERKAKQRTQNVTEMSRSNRDKSVTREEKTLLTPPTPSFEPEKKTKRFVKPTVEEVIEHCREKGYTFDARSFHAFYEAKGWVVGKSPMKDWRAACVTWARRDASNQSSTPTQMSDDKWNVHNMKGDAR